MTDNKAPTTSTKRLTSGLEDYLEAVYMLQLDKGFARVKDIAEMLGVRAPSVTGAMQSLAERGLINYQPYEYITLTESGSQRASTVAHKHWMLKSFFSEFLRIEEKAAEAAACECEHRLPQQAYVNISQLMKFMRSPDGARFNKLLGEYLK
ncbi:MAG: metal-dependent transcriptional regulator [Phycisphaerae bacterium]|jgi:DtxR family Mn-dependent transcriptional regulator